jgi:mxaJ protein
VLGEGLMEDYSVQRIGVSLIGGLFLAMVVLCGSSHGGPEPKTLRVCADPNNLPFSNEKLEGFENKIAALVAQDLGASLSYTWWPHQRGLVRRTLNEDLCDVLMGVPKGYDPVLWTKPYYRSAYVIASLKERGLQITSLDDPLLQQLKIGVHVNSPPHDALAQRGIVGAHVVAYRLFYTPQAHAEEYPSKVLEDVLAGQLDVALVWGPFAGYFVKQRSAPVVLVPLRGGSRTTPFTFEISIGVRKGEKALKAELEEALNRQAASITAILEEYGVPLVAADVSAGEAKGSEAPREGHKHEEGSHRH